jgi:hypothetical protein
MWKFLVAVMIAVAPISAYADDKSAPPATNEAGGGLGRTMLITAGVVGGVVIADVLTGGALTAPILAFVGLGQKAPATAAAAVSAVAQPVSLAMQEARAAGAVFGEQIAAATQVRDMAARSDMLYAGTIGLGGLLGGFLISRFASGTPDAPDAVH